MVLRVIPQWTEHLPSGRSLLNGCWSSKVPGGAGCWDSTAGGAVPFEKAPRSCHSQPLITMEEEARPSLAWMLGFLYLKPKKAKQNIREKRPSQCRVYSEMISESLSWLTKWKLLLTSSSISRGRTATGSSSVTTGRAVYFWELEIWTRCSPEYKDGKSLTYILEIQIDRSK